MFETNAGKAWGTLHVNLGEHPGQAQQHSVLPQEQAHKKLSPSKQRRMERRKAAREEAADVEAEEESNAGIDATIEEVVSVVTAQLNLNLNSSWE